MFPTDSEYILLYFVYFSVFIYFFLGLIFTKKTLYKVNLTIFMVYFLYMFYIFLDEDNFKGGNSLGNIIDSVFYGVIFNDSYHQVATAFADQPYGTWFHGEVVDMFYFPMWEGNLPSWLPIWGGKHFTFFNAIFNVAYVS